VRETHFLEWEIILAESFHADIGSSIFLTNGGINTNLFQSTNPLLLGLVSFALWLGFLISFAHADALKCKPPTQSRVQYVSLWNIAVPMSGFERLNRYRTHMQIMFESVRCCIIVKSKVHAHKYATRKNITVESFCYTHLQLMKSLLPLFGAPSCISFCCWNAFLFFIWQWQ
jgi:hypothetical protein